MILFIKLYCSGTCLVDTVDQNSELKYAYSGVTLQCLYGHLISIHTL